MDEADFGEESVVLGLLAEVIRVNRDALRLEVRSDVSSREDTTIDAVLTARSGSGVMLLLTSSGAAARTREVGFATVGRVKIVIIPTVLAHVVAKTRGTVANVVLESIRISGNIDVVNLTESVRAAFVVLTVVTVLTVDIILELSTVVVPHWSIILIEITIDVVSGVKKRAVESTLVQGLIVSLSGLAAGLQVGVQSIGT